MSLPHFAIEMTSLLGEPLPTGIPRYAAELARALSLQASSVDADFTLGMLYRSSHRSRTGILPRGTGVRWNSWRKSYWPIRRRFTLIHTPHESLPPWPGIPMLATIHDVYPAVGVNNWTTPEQCTRQMNWYREAAERCIHVLCDSESTRRDFIHYFGFPADRATTVHLGVDARFTPQPPERCREAQHRHGLHKPYFFSLGLGHTNKNLQRLIVGFAKSGLAKDVDLVLAGPKPPHQQSELEQTIIRAGVRGRVKLLGFIDDADVVPLYSGAAAVALPSLYEGFGFAILEGMRCGTPVLTSTGGSCPEVANGHAVIVDPLDVSAIGRGLAKAIEMPKNEREAARCYAETKTWGATATATLAVYRQVAADSGH